ncbi:FecR domain-containing protein [Allorhodopirellula solitaria]|nr:FecR domain-containing protein [Allorhodopirellula solitaria]
MKLIGMVRDGDLSDDQQSELEAMLEQDPGALAYYVESIDLISTLHRQQGIAGDDQVTQTPQPTALPAAQAPASPAPIGWSSALQWSGAVLASLAIGVLVGRLFLPIRDNVATLPANVNLVSAKGKPEIATLTSASGCVWGPPPAMPHDARYDVPYEGQRLTARALRLAEGVAVVHFDCDVRLVLEGPADLDLVSVDRARLNRGKVVFTGEGDLDRFTLATPFSEIRDEGTEYAVSVEESGTVGEIHVFDGRVSYVPIDESPADTAETSIQVESGQARRFIGSRQVETITLDPSRFVRSPISSRGTADSATTIETFAYDAKALVGLTGGWGWRGAWSQPSRFDSKQGAVLRPSDSLAWSKTRTQTSDGSLILAGDTGLHRTLQDPIRMDRNAAYYLSFLVQKHSATGSENSNGWAYLTLRDPRTEAEKIAIRLTSTRGIPRVAHKGRAANATNRLNNETVYLIVCKILARQDQEDQVSVRIYGDDEPVDSVEPSAWTIKTRPVDDDSVFSELRLYSKNSDPIALDNIRIGRTWSSVASEYSN